MNIISPRKIHILSDDGRYVIKAQRVSLQDGYSLDNGATYNGSCWTGVTILKDGKEVRGIQVRRGNYQPYIHYGEYGCGLCQNGIKLSKDVILYGAIQTGMFTRALEGIDCDKIEKNYHKAYWAKRIEIFKERI